MPDWIVELDPRFRPCVLPNAQLLTLGEGYAWLEGPVWFADANQLLVSDLPHNRILRWTEDSGVSVFRQPSNFENGHTRDRQGRLIGCSHHGRCINRTELDGSVTVLADRFNGKPLNGPNDVVAASDGAIWFSDPYYGGNTDYEGGKHLAELPPTLYRLDPNGSLEIAADDFIGPNGLCFSPMSACSTWPKAAASSPNTRRGTSGCSTLPMAGCATGAYSTTSHPASPMACAATRMAGSGAAPGTAFTASTRTAR